MKLKFVYKGGPGSGFHGHAGIPGHQGGSQAANGGVTEGGRYYKKATKFRTIETLDGKSVKMFTVDIGEGLPDETIDMLEHNRPVPAVFNPDDRTWEIGGKDGDMLQHDEIANAAGSVKYWWGMVRGWLMRNSNPKGRKYVMVIYDPRQGGDAENLLELPNHQEIANKFAQNAQQAKTGIVDVSYALAAMDDVSLDDGTYYKELHKMYIVCKGI